MRYCLQDQDGQGMCVPSPQASHLAENVTGRASNFVLRARVGTGTSQAMRSRSAVALRSSRMRLTQLCDRGVRTVMDAGR